MIDLRHQFLTFQLILFVYGCVEPEQQTIKKWQKIQLQFAGPNSSEGDSINPFLDYRLTVSFSNGEKYFEVPGYYAADGNAANTGANSGNVWRVHFLPADTGKWTYEVSFRHGKNIAISENPSAGIPVYFDGSTDEFKVEQSSHRGKIVSSGGHYPVYGGSGEFYLKVGAGSPENFLAFEDFDDTYRYVSKERSGEVAVKQSIHTYQPHVGDWLVGDPTWKDDKGKGIIGALNYLASKGMNSVYFLTLNIQGDGEDVWPYVSYFDRERFDCSKLDQWNIVFDHMDELGLSMHLVTQETENELMLDSGNTTFQRKLYYRELIARFGHHYGVFWNMGEENGPAPHSPQGQNTSQREAMLAYFKEHDPYNSVCLIHSHLTEEYMIKVFDEMLGYPNLDGISMQSGFPELTGKLIQDWRAKSIVAGRPWMITVDEIGHASRGVDQDDRIPNNQDTLRAEVLWKNLMSGGAGVEWYFGWMSEQNDINCEDWRSRDRMWDYSQYALNFFKTLPLDRMKLCEASTGDTNNLCICVPGETYAIYCPNGGPAQLDLSNESGSFKLEWYNPRNGDKLELGSFIPLIGGSKVDLGSPPENPNMDWVILVTKV